ncbi:AT-rich interactive domain-containing protein 1B-like [Penaeus monodon]|uniref:AT-rich interactive domain-containing protein 1B-like n=1 Tax=Penaeus monodon TaxID=6687 RepID=UPI0018A6E1DE|nr:AT-rich interactive domain-containing protein 1B-like [Penaeus monodon]
MNLLRGVSVLAMVCMVSAAKLPGYSAGGDSGLGVDLSSAGGHGGGAGGAGSGSVFPAVFVGSGNLPASAIVGPAGVIGGGAVGQEYTEPSTDPVAPVVTVEEEYTGPGAGPVAPVVTVEEEYTGPSIDAGPDSAASPAVTFDEEYSEPSIDVAPVAPVPTVEEEYTGPNEVAHVSPPAEEYISPNH